MRITEIAVKNFRCLRDVRLPLGEMTVVIGENNAGKTALLEAIKLILGRRWGQRGSGFSEYDFFMNEERSNPRNSDPISVELTFSETDRDEWDQDIKAALHDVIQTDPASELDSITLLAKCGYEQLADTLETDWQFLGRDKRPLTGASRRATNAHPFFQYVPIFSLSALRDVSQEFSSRSQLWGQLLKSINIPDGEWGDIEEQLETLNDELLRADPKLNTIRDKIQELKSVVSPAAASSVDIRALPLKVWDLISRAEIFIRGRAHDPWLPLTRHGQGVQSLAVIYLFQAFVEHLLADSFTALSEPILLLEEPEAHLHPQAARALSPEIRNLTGQKIITTHSPYFVENVPFKDVHIIRNYEGGARVFSLQDEFRLPVPRNAELDGVVANNPQRLSYDAVSGELTVRGTLPERLYRNLLTCYTGAEERKIIHPLLATLREDTRRYLSPEELQDLQIWARRIRGEIFFARAWLLCEGQTEHLLMHAINDALGLSLDAHGIAVIDYQNSGSPGAFAALARALGFPWLMTCDGDAGGDGLIEQVRSREFSDRQIEERIHQLPARDMEEFLVNNGFFADLVEIATDLDDDVPSDGSAEQVAEFVRRRKVDYAAALARRLRDEPRAPDSFPQYFRKIRDQLEVLISE